MAASAGSCKKSKADGEAAGNQDNRFPSIFVHCLSQEKAQDVAVDLAFVFCDVALLTNTRQFQLGTRFLVQLLDRL